MTVDTLDPDLLASKKEKAEPPPAPASFQKRLLKGLAYFWIFVCALVFFCSLKIPATLVEGLVLNTLNQNRSQHWQADKIQFLFFLPHLRVENLSLETQGQSFLIQEAKVFPDFLSLIPGLGGPSFGVEATVYGGKISGSVSPKAPSLNLVLESLDLSKIAPLLDAGISQRGILSKITLQLENDRLSTLNGNIRAEGKGFVVDPAAFNSPLPLPILDLGSMQLNASAERGKLKIEKLVLGSPGKDLEVRVTGEIQLADTIQFSRIDLKFALKPSEKILQALPAVRTMLGNMGALQGDGFYNMKISGTVARLGIPQPDR